MKDIFKDKTILVTGGCGSIGSEIVRQLLQFEPKSIRVFDHDEAGHFKLGQRLQSKKIRPLIGDIRDKERVMRAMEDVDIVFHAAALKHVPLCEYNPFEAVNTNVAGTKNLVDVAIQNRIEKFIGISTDKAVNPINTMGATKLLSEKVITNAPIGMSKVKFCCVRFGNVLNSVGSVIPIFKAQIKKGGPLTITDNNMTRFFMDVSEAVRLVLQAARLTEGGETFILKMEALRIKDLAEVLAEQLAPRYGHDADKIDYTWIGIRPGEKLHESLMTEEEAKFMAEAEGMLILRNSLLYRASKSEVSQNGDVKMTSYESNKIGLLTKDQIKDRLVQKKIV